MKMWDSDLGIWYLLETRWLTIHGTTPTNAGVWSLDIDASKYSVWFSTGPHAAVYLWRGDKIIWCLERDNPNCACYRCVLSKRHMTAEELQSLTNAINNPDRATRKLAPRRTDGA